MAKLIDGRAIAEKVYVDLRREIAELKAKGATPGLAVILVGDNQLLGHVVEQMSAWVSEAWSCSFNATTTAELSRRCREAKSSPTKMTARPGVAPFALSSAISRRRSTYTFSAIARPSINLAIVFVIPSVVEEPLPNPR